MRDRPAGAELARLAQAIGGDEALAVRCHAIAAREASAGDAAFAPLSAVLATRYGADGNLLKRLADEIAAGAFDAEGPARDWARQILWAITRQKLSESNPEFLAASGEALRA